MCGPTPSLAAFMASATDYNTLPINWQDVVRARENIGDLVRNTPVMTCTYLNGVAGFELFFKCENFQTTGSFKVRRRPVVFKSKQRGALEQRMISLYLSNFED